MLCVANISAKSRALPYAFAERGSYARVHPCVDVTVFSDNIGKGLAKAEFEDFPKECPGVSVAFKKTGGTFHGRFVVMDHGKQGERVFTCGASSKDAGLRKLVIMESTLPGPYDDIVSRLLDNPELVRR